MPKNIVFCADGTWNGPNSDDQDGVPETTNVWKLFLNLAGDATPDSVLYANEQELSLSVNGQLVQVAKYLHGVGDSRGSMGIPLYVEAGDQRVDVFRFADTALSLAVPRTDDPLDGVRVPVSSQANPAGDMPSHLQQVHADLVLRLPVRSGDDGAHHTAPASNDAEYASYIENRIAAWKES